MNQADLALYRQLGAWAEAFPGLVRLTSPGRTPEGRDIWPLTVEPEFERARPSVWVEGDREEPVCLDTMAH